jgi:hypothetical protein
MSKVIMACLRTCVLALAAALPLSCGLVASAQALVFDFSYSGGSGKNAVSGSGEFITSSTGSPYTVTGVTGVANGFAITGVTYAYAGADNLLYVPGSHYVDFSGISFTTANHDAWGIGWTGSHYGIAELFKDPFGYCCGVNPINFTVTPAVHGAPGPVAGAGLPGLMLAVGGLLVWWRGRRKSPQPM